MKIKLLPYDRFWASHAVSPAGTLPIIKNYSGSDIDNSENRRIAYNNYKKALREAGKLQE